MPGESLSFDITARDQASSSFRSVGRAAEDASVKMDLAAASAKLWDDTQAKSGKAATTSANAFKAHAAASKLLADAENVLAGKATVTTKLLADQGRAVEDAGQSAEKAAGGFGALAGGGGIPGGGMGALIGAGVALAPVLVTVGFGLTGLAAAAYGVAKPIENAAQKTGGLTKNMHLLNPEQQAVAKSLLTLGKTYAAFQQHLQPTLFKDFGAGLRLAGTLLREVQPVAKSTGTALAQLLTGLNQQFQTQNWQQFFGFMAGPGAADVRILDQTIVHLVGDIPPLVTALQPLTKAILTTTNDAAAGIGPITNWVNSFEAHNPLSTQSFFKGLHDLDQWSANIENKIPGFHAVSNWITSFQNSVSGSGGAAQSAVPKIQHATQAVSDLMKTTVTTVTPMDHLGKSTATTSFTVSEYGKNANLTVSPVDRLGKASEVSAAYIGHVATAADFANTKVIDVRNSVRDLTTALSKGLDPLLAYSNALLTQKSDAKNLASALQASGDKVGFATAAQRNSFSVANTYIGDLENTAQKALASHQGIDAEITSLRNSLPMLQNVKSGTRLYWQEVQTLITYLDKLRQEKAIREAVTVFGSGTWSLSQPGGKLAGPTGTAAGWLVSGGSPGRDSVPIMAMPGELVVPSKMVSSGAVDHLRGSIPGFAGGGVVGSYSGAVAGLPPWVSRNQAASVRAVTADIAESFARAFKAEFRSASGARSPGFGITPSGPLQSYARSLLAAYGWANQWPQFNAVVMRESGWNVHATNPTSGAYGIPQALPPGKMASAGADWRTDGFTQLRWMMGYIKSAYGSPAGAWNSELTRGWYDRGGWLKPGLTLAYNGTGRPEMVVPHSSQQPIVLEVASSGNDFDAFLLKWLQKNARIRGGGSVQTAFGRT